MFESLGPSAVPSAVLDAILDGAPGPGLAAQLLSLDPVEMSDLQRFEYLRAWSRVESWVAACKARAVALVADLDQAESYPEGYVVANAGAELVSAALRVTPWAAQSEVGWSRLLISPCTRTLQALEAGAITPRSARVITEETLELGPEQVTEVESRVLDRAETQTPHELRRSVRRAVAQVAPRQQAARCEQETGRRCVNLTPAPHGMAYLEAYLPAPEAQGLYSVLTECAHSAKGRDRRAARDAGLPAAAGRAGAPGRVPGRRTGPARGPRRPGTGGLRCRPGPLACAHRRGPAHGIGPGRQPRRAARLRAGPRPARPPPGQ